VTFRSEIVYLKISWGLKFHICLIYFFLKSQRIPRELDAGFTSTKFTERKKSCQKWPEVVLSKTSKKDFETLKTGLPFWIGYTHLSVRSGSYLFVGFFLPKNGWKKHGIQKWDCRNLTSETFLECEDHICPYLLNCFVLVPQ